LLPIITNTFMMEFSSIKFTEIIVVCYHIMHIRDIVIQLKDLEVTMFDSFLVHYIMYVLPHLYAPILKSPTNK